jgi:SPP1 gp7 family putative phage head morphogenesis protein
MKKLSALKMDSDTFLIDAAARHAHWLERYKTQRSNVALRMMAQIKKEIIAEIANGTVSTLAQSKDLESKIDRILSDGLEKVTAEITVELKSFGASQAGFEVMTIQGAAAGAVKVTKPTASQVWALANTRPFNNKLLKETYAEFTDESRKVIRNTVRRAFFEGFAMTDLIKELKGSKEMGFNDGTFSGIDRKLKMLVSGSVSHMANAARSKVYEDNSDLVTHVRWLSTLDSRTSGVCRGLDGQLFEVGKAPNIPLHPNCRSTTTAVIDPQYSKRNRSLSVRPTKGADGAGKFKGAGNYSDWLRSQPKSFQEDILGKKKAALFRDGGLEMKNFIHDEKELSMADLERNYPKAWEKAGL